MNVTLTPDQDALVAQAVASGHYASAEHFVAEALRLLAEQERVRAENRQQFQTELQHRLDALDRGEVLTNEALETHFREKAAKRRQQAA